MGISLSQEQSKVHFCRLKETSIPLTAKRRSMPLSRAGKPVRIVFLDLSVTVLPELAAEGGLFARVLSCPQTSWRSSGSRYLE